jgi:hypothetical protein
MAINQQYKPHPIRDPFTAEDVDYNFDLLYRMIKDLVVFVGDVLQVPKGGTGISNYLTGDMLYADSATTLAKLSAVATGSAIISQGTQTPPVWGKINLVDPLSHLTGFTAKGDLLTYDGSDYTRFEVGTSGYYLRSSSSASSGLEWAAVSAGGGGDLDTILTDGDHVMLDDDGNVLYSG